MASTILHSLFIISSAFLLSLSESRPPFTPDNHLLLFPVHKDAATGLHVATIPTRTPSLPLPFVLDLNGRFLWANCDKNYSSSTYRTPFCHSTQCSHAGFHSCLTCPEAAARPGCHNNTCGVLITNPLTGKTAVSELAQDVLSIQSITRNSSHAVRILRVRRFLFACAPPKLLDGPLPEKTQGFAGLAHTPVALPYQLASRFGFPPKFTMCLPSTSNVNGSILFGNAGVFFPGAKYTYTPLVVSPQGGYFVRLRSISLNTTTVISDPSPASKGFLTMISTTSPYTVMQHYFYQALATIFANQLSWLPRADLVSPFELCFNSSHARGRLGLGLPRAEFVFYNRNASWRMNLMVEARPGVSCLGVVDGGLRTRVPIVIGSKQLEDNLVEFDLEMSRLGFSTAKCGHLISTHKN